MNITVQITGAQEIEAKLNRLGAGLYQLDSSMRQIGQYLAKYFSSEAFASQGQVFGSTWQRLSPRYSIWKAKHFPGRPPLVQTGEMENSFYYEAGSSSVVIGNRSEKFAWHQLGTSRGIPARPMEGINDTNKRMIGTILSAEIRAKIEAA